jgi:NAD-dependent dihydropyrimidine dehydrogenase PreA subunit
MYPYVKKIEIDETTCIHCKTCFEACFIDVYRWDDIEEHPIIAYPEDCVGCFACEIACPVQCIEVIPIIPLEMPSIANQ